MLTGTEILELNPGPAPAMWSMAVSPNPARNHIAGYISLWEGWIVVWDVVTGTELFKLDKFDKNNRSFGALAFSPSGKHIALGAAWREREVKIWEVDTWTELHTLHGGGLVVSFDRHLCS